MKPGQMKIVAALINHYPNHLSFTELKTETELSGTALSEYLKILQGIGPVFRDIEGKYRVKAVYLPRERQSETGKEIREMIDLVLTSGIPLIKIKDPNKRLKLVRQYTEAFVLSLSPFILWGTIQTALVAASLRVGKKGKAESFRRVLRQSLIDWLEPFVENLALVLVRATSGLDGDLVEKKAAVEWEQKFVDYLLKLQEGLKEEGINVESLDEVCREVINEREEKRKNR